jgi:small GTP-binding protein
MSGKYDFSFKVLILGDTTVGKTCILLRFADDSFSAQHITTIGVDFRLKIIDVGGKLIKLQIWDTAGQERFRTITKAYYKGSHGIILTYDITNRESFKNVTHWIKQIETSGVENLVKVLVANKCDLPDRMVTEEEGQKLAQEYGMQFFEASAKNNININETFKALTDEMLKSCRGKSNTTKNINNANLDSDGKKKKKCLI